VGGEILFEVNYNWPPLLVALCYQCCYQSHQCWWLPG